MFTVKKRNFNTTNIKHYCKYLGLTIKVQIDRLRTIRTSWTSSM